MDEAAGQTRDEVLTAVAAAGCTVTGDQLARWHRARLLPQPVRRSLGRGLGTVTIYPEGTVDRVVALWAMRSRHSNLSKAAFELWWEGFEVEADVIRATLLEKATALDAEFPALLDFGQSGKAKGGFGSFINRRLGPARRKRLEAAIREAAQDVATVRVSMPTLEGDITTPPSLDEMFERVIPFLMVALSGTSLVELIQQSSAEQLCEARDEFKVLLSSLTQWAEPMAWLFGKRGAVFRLLADMRSAVSPDDYPDIVCASLLIRRFVPAELRALVTAAPPPMLGDIAAFKAVHDLVPGAERVVTPMAVRALLRGKEASGRYLPAVQTFFQEHEAEVRAVIDPELFADSGTPSPDPLAQSSGESPA